ncbi:GNAT family N-acetyltransferase [Pyrococcus kukulkanii]|uniref:GNAT family N-acetyltransferase n=1 Tax=Pyrococcus kukulkanii TaxID=1609559 RepID=UPI003562550A
MLVRKATPRDRPFVEETARLTWNGEDYLARVFEKWLKDEHFYVLELNGRVIGTAKLTFLPERVGWLEGLRVHPNYRGRGYGRELHNFMLELGEKLATEGKIEALEFSTCFLNKESIAMAKKDGFKVVARFYYIQKILIHDDIPEKTKIDPSDELDIPYSWMFLHNCRESRKWLNRKAVIRKYHGLKFLYPPTNMNEPTFTPFELSLEAIESLLPAISFETEKIGYDSIDIMLPKDKGELIEGARRSGVQEKLV